MRRCPKCSATFDEALNFCQVCGAMLEKMAEEPARAADTMPQKKDEKPEAVPGPAIGKDASKGTEARLPLTEKAKPAVTAQKLPRQCLKCGSTKMIPDARTRIRGSEGTFSVYVDAFPNAWVFKERAYSELLADICADCGHVELKVLDARALYNNYLQSKEN